MKFHKKHSGNLKLPKKTAANVACNALQLRSIQHYNTQLL